MIVYLITNLVSDKKYVGLTTRDIKIRWYEHVKKSKQSNLSDLSLHKDIFIHGKKNFRIDILRECTSISEMSFYERKFIQDLDTIKNGYNQNSGGTYYEVSEKLKNKLSLESNLSKEVYVYYTSGDFFNKFHSVNESARVLNIDTRKVFRVLCGNRKSTNGYIFSYEKIENIDYKNNVCRSILKYDSLGNFIKKYKSINECSLDNNVNRVTINRSINEKKYFVKGNYYFDDNFNIKEFDFNLKKMLYQYDSLGNLIDKYLKINDVVEKTGISKSSIYRMMNNKIKKNKYYFIWK
jgi:group I intron endonuclease